MVFLQTKGRAQVRVGEVQRSPVYYGWQVPSVSDIHATATRMLAEYKHYITKHTVRNYAGIKQQPVLVNLCDYWTSVSVRKSRLLCRPVVRKLDYYKLQLCLAWRRHTFAGETWRHNIVNKVTPTRQLPRIESCICCYKYSYIVKVRINFSVSLSLPTLCQFGLSQFLVSIASFFYNLLSPNLFKMSYAWVGNRSCSL